MGTAFGRIRIDTSDLNQARTVIRSVAQEAERGFQRIGASARTAQSSFAGVASSISAIAGPFGIVFGAAGVASLARFALASAEIATSYERQSVAALQLAGSQSNLNSLLAAYESATGGAIDKATALADVTRLQAVGFADTAAELTRFVTVARGISLAMGRTQEYVLGELQLAIANQSTRRLDQIGLGVTEVNNRIDQLRASNSALTREMAFQEAVLAIAEEKYGALAQSAEAQATGAEKAAKAWKDLRLEFGLLVDEPVGEKMGELAEAIGGVTTILELAGDQAERLNQLLGGIAGNEEVLRILSFFVNPVQGSVQGLFGALGDLNTAGQFRAQAAEAARLSQFPQAGGMTRAIQGTNTFGNVIGAPGAAPLPTDAINAWAADVQQIEREAASQRLEATQRYEQQRSDAIASYARSIAREAEDYARQRARQEAQLAADIAEIRQDAVARERDWTAAYVESMAEIRADANERIADIEEDYARNRERRERQHRDNLLSAAGRLDASAILAEKRRYAEESRNADEARGEQISDANEQLAERLRDEEEAHQERLQAAREADEERIQDMIEAQRERQRIEDEDRAIQLQRQAEDHQAQLREMDRTHAQRLTQIDRQAADERAALDEAFTKELADLGTYNEGWKTLQEARQAQSLRLFKDWWDDLDEVINERMTGNLPPTQPQGALGPYASGGFVPRTGLAQLHAGEYVLNAQTTRALDAMMGGMNQRNLVTMAGNRTVSLAMHPGAIQVNAAPGQDASQIAMMVRQEIIGTLQEVM